MPKKTIYPDNKKSHKHFQGISFLFFFLFWKEM